MAPLCLGAGDARQPSSPPQLRSSSLRSVGATSIPWRHRSTSWLDIW